MYSHLAFNNLAKGIPIKLYIMFLQSVALGHFQRFVKSFLGRRKWQEKLLKRINRTSRNDPMPRGLHSGWSGCRTGNGEKLSNNQVQLGQACLLLSFSLFPVRHPLHPLCTASESVQVIDFPDDFKEVEAVSVVVVGEEDDPSLRLAIMSQLTRIFLFDTRVSQLKLIRVVKSLIQVD